MDSLQRYERTAAKYLAAKESLAGAIITARRAGVSWTEIGRPLGITKQAAQQKFGGMTTLADAHLVLPQIPSEVQSTHRPPRVDAYDKKLSRHDGS